MVAFQAHSQSERHYRRTSGACRQDTALCVAVNDVQSHRQTSRRYGSRLFFRHYHFPKRSKHTEADKGSGDVKNDSIWATVLGIARIFNVTEKYVLYEMSYLNALMYSRAMPMPGDVSETSDRPLYDDALDANNPQNFDKFNEETITVYGTK